MKNINVDLKNEKKETSQASLLNQEIYVTFDILQKYILYVIRTILVGQLLLFSILLTTSILLYIIFKMPEIEIFYLTKESQVINGIHTLVWLQCNDILWILCIFNIIFSYFRFKNFLQNKIRRVLEIVFLILQLFIFSFAAIIYTQYNNQLSKLFTWNNLIIFKKYSIEEKLEFIKLILKDKTYNIEQLKNLEFQKAISTLDMEQLPEYIETNFKFLTYFSEDFKYENIVIFMLLFSFFIVGVNSNLGKQISQMCNFTFDLARDINYTPAIIDNISTVTTVKEDTLTLTTEFYNLLKHGIITIINYIL